VLVNDTVLLCSRTTQQHCVASCLHCLTRSFTFVALLFLSHLRKFIRPHHGATYLAKLIFLSHFYHSNCMNQGQCNPLGLSQQLLSLHSSIVRPVRVYVQSVSGVPRVNYQQVLSLYNCEFLCVQSVSGVPRDGGPVCVCMCKEVRCST